MARKRRRPRKSRSLKKSEEADRKGLTLGRAEGKAYGRTLKHMANEVADAGGMVRKGDYIVGYAVEKAEGMYMPTRGGRLKWMEPKRENAHLEVSVRDRADGRFIPVLGISVTVADARGKKIGTYRLPLLWHPYLYHYGKNVRLPGDGTYSLRVRFEAPDFHRHDKKNGKRMAKDADVTFRRVKIETGKG